MDLVEAAATADALAREPGNERELATLRAQWDDELEAAARSADYRVRGHAFRAIGQFRFRQKLELLRRGLEDESAAARGSALIALTSLSTDHPGDVNGYRPALNELAARDPNLAVRRLAIVCLRNGPPDRGNDPAAREPRAGRRHRPGGPRGGTRGGRRAREEGPREVGLDASRSSGVIMGSRSDWETMRHTAETLDGLGIPFEQRVVSAHRTPDLLFDYAASAESRGLRVLVAGAGGAAHLPGMAASKTTLPVLGVPVESKALSGMDSLLSIVQMPAGVPVGTLAIGRAGAVNAALLAAAILAGSDAALRGPAAPFPRCADAGRAGRSRPGRVTVAGVEHHERV